MHQISRDINMSHKHGVPSSVHLMSNFGSCKTWSQDSCYSSWKVLKSFHACPLSCETLMIASSKMWLTMGAASCCAPEYNIAISTTFSPHVLLQMLALGLLSLKLCTSIPYRHRCLSNAHVALERAVAVRPIFIRRQMPLQQLLTAAQSFSTVS